MRVDQFEKLQQLGEKLADVFLVEAEPSTWPGHGMLPANMDQQTRGDRYWVKKNAVATLSLMQRVGALIGQVQAFGDGPSPGDAPDPDAEAVDHLDAEVKAAEAEAAKLLRELQTGHGKAAFDKRVHGRAPG